MICRDSSVHDKPLVELTEEAIRILYRELGTVNTVRFLRQFSPNLGDYTRARQEQTAGETLDDLLVAIRQRRSRTAATYQARLDAIRRRHPRAYEKWTAEEDAQLRSAVEAGKTVQEIAVLLGRQPGAITSRLQKLGLTP